MTKVHGKRYAYKFDFAGLAKAHAAYNRPHGVQVPTGTVHVQLPPQHEPSELHESSRLYSFVDIRVFPFSLQLLVRTWGQHLSQSLQPSNVTSSRSRDLTYRFISIFLNTGWIEVEFVCVIFIYCFFLLLSCLVDLYFSAYGVNSNLFHSNSCWKGTALQFMAVLNWRIDGTISSRDTVPHFVYSSIQTEMCCCLLFYIIKAMARSSS